jgi:hypothetical protein
MKGKEEYLWSKTGTADSEIERLENALQVLRYDAASNAPLVLPAKVVPFRKESSLPSFSTHRVFRRALAFAACAAFVAVLLGVRYQIIPNDNYSEIGSAEALVVPKNYAPFPVIAERTGLKPESVRVNLHRGMKLLREKLGIEE